MSVLNNKYKILSLLSKNEVSSVFLGQSIVDGKNIIIKLAIPGQERIASIRFGKEYSILNNLDHPNIVKAIDFSNKIPYLVVEYIEGENALVTYKNNSVPLDESYTVLFQIYDAIKYLHLNNFIHRDIKPSNIIIEKNTKRAVLVDFETARDAHKEDNIRIHSGDFSPPELWRGYSGYFTDVYSLAKMALFILSDKMSTEKQSLYSRLDQMMEGDYTKRSIYVDEIMHVLPQKPLLYFYQENMINKIYPVNDAQIRIGRAKNCEINIEDNKYFVCEVHAIIKKENEHHIICDNNSINGLWLFDKGNFIRITQHFLRNNDLLCLGYNKRNGPYISFRFFG